jgi:cytochrome c peroxidase
MAASQSRCYGQPVLVAPVLRVRRSILRYDRSEGSNIWALVFTCSALLAAYATHAGEKDWNVEALRRIANPPLGLPPLPLAKQDEPGSERIALGRKLFFDPRLSGNSSMSCATCHVPEQGFTQKDRLTPKGAEGRSLRRNAPSLLNVGYNKFLMWDGGAPSLQSQILTPLFEPHEMANPTFKGLLERMRTLPDYEGRFEKVFGTPATVPLIGKAIASYEVSLVSANSAFDHWRYGGESGALGADAQRGLRLFTGKAGCSVCHRIDDRAALFTDQSFHNTGVGFLAVQARAEDPDDRGRQEVTNEPADLHKFKTPTLRNVALTAPYMHNGLLRSLQEVVRYYNGGGSSDPAKDPKVHPLGLTDDEIRDLVAFLESLNGDNLESLVAEARETKGGN